MSGSNLPPGCSSDDGLTGEDRAVLDQLEKLSDDLSEWIAEQPKPLEIINEIRIRYLESRP